LEVSDISQGDGIVTVTAKLERLRPSEEFEIHVLVDNLSVFRGEASSDYTLVSEGFDDSPGWS
jgi:hypothetical protein